MMNRQEGRLLEAVRAGKAYFDLMLKNMDEPDSWTSAKTLAGEDLDSLFTKWMELSDTVLMDYPPVEEHCV